MKQEITFDKNSEYWYQKGIEDFKNIISHFSETQHEKLFIQKLEGMAKETLMQTFNVQKALNQIMLKMEQPPKKKKWYQIFSKS